MYVVFAGRNIVSLVTSEAENLSKRRCTCKADNITQEALESAIKSCGTVLEDIRVI